MKGCLNIKRGCSGPDVEAALMRSARCLYASLSDADKAVAREGTVPESLGAEQAAHAFTAPADIRPEPRQSSGDRREFMDFCMANRQAIREQADTATAAGSACGWVAKQRLRQRIAWSLYQGRSRDDREAIRARAEYARAQRGQPAQSPACLHCVGVGRPAARRLQEIGAGFIDCVQDGDNGKLTPKQMFLRAISRCSQSAKK